MRLKINNYIYHNQFIDNLTILNLSDIHGNIKHIDYILKYLKNIKVDYIFIPGDIFDKIDNDNAEFLNKIKLLGKYAKTYIVIGNHDNLKGKKNLLPIDILNENIYIKELKSSENIYLNTDSYNKIKLNDKIDLHFIVLPNEYYSSKEKKNISNLFLKKIKNNNVDKKKLNIMLIHSPSAIVNNNKLIDNKLINSMDLILSGHVHGGLTPTTIQDILHNNIGLFGPHYTLLQKNAYGIIKTKKTNLLISNGITKISESTFLKKSSLIINKFLIPELDLIKLKKSNNNNLVLLNRKIYKGEK